MNSSSILVRQTDRKTFRVAMLGRWSDIIAEDGEKDSVKWYGGDAACQLYVSASKGHSYEVRP